MRVPSGVTDQYIYFLAVDVTDMRTRETGLSGFAVYRSRNGAAAVLMTPTLTEIDATNMPGLYRLLLDEDMTIDTGDDSQEMCFHVTHASMAPYTRTVELYRSNISAYLSATAISVLTSVSSPAISLAKDSSEPHPVLVITDATDAAINLSGKTLRMNVWDPEDGSGALASQTFTTADKLSIGGVDNNQVTLDHAASDVPAVAELKYDLWNVTDNYLLAQGIWSVYQTVLTAAV